MKPRTDGRVTTARGGFPAATKRTPRKNLGNSERLTSAKADKEESLAKLAKLRLEREKGRWVAKDQHIKILSDLAEAVRSVLEPLPVRECNYLASITSPNEMATALEALVTRILSKLEQGE